MQNCVFLCSLDKFLLKNVIVFFFDIKFQNGAHLKERAILDLLFTVFSHLGNDTKVLSAQIPPKYVYSLILLTFLPSQFCTVMRINHVLFLFGVTPRVDSFSHHFGAINKNSVQYRKRKKITAL